MKFMIQNRQCKNKDDRIRKNEALKFNNRTISNKNNINLKVYTKLKISGYPTLEISRISGIRQISIRTNPNF